jgi:hypothetical protein
MSDPVGALKDELVAAAERRLANPRARSRRNRVLIIAAVLTISASLALVFAAPWSSTPGFMERAQAALAPEGVILHYRYVEVQTSEDFGCTAVMGPNEVWIDQEWPHRWRSLMEQFEPPPRGADERTRACLREGEVAEIGGAMWGQPTLKFEPPRTLRGGTGQFLTFEPDPARVLREAIAGGRAHHEGNTEVDGRTVARIRIECLHPPCSGPRPHTYVDPETFALVREEWPLGFTWVPGADGREFRFDVVRRYPTFEYLPRTAANVALADIRAQHPDAIAPSRRYP